MKLLEIGPFTNPDFKDENVKYFEVSSRSALIERAKHFSLPIKSIPKKLDYVDKHGDLSIINDEFDYVYSAHNIEHQIDLIKHLNQVYDILKENGKFLLVIPDKRCCFDPFVSETVMSDVLEAHYLKLKRHTLKTQLTSCESTHNDPSRHWIGDHGKDLVKRTDYNELECYKNTLNKFLNTNEYLDSHKWRFRPENFVFICNSLYRMGLVKLKLEKVYCTQKDSFQFMAILKK